MIRNSRVRRWWDKYSPNPAKSRMASIWGGNGNKRRGRIPRRGIEKKERTWSRTRERKI